MRNPPKTEVDLFVVRFQDWKLCDRDIRSREVRRRFRERLNFNKFVFTRADAKLGSRLNGMNAVAAGHALHEVLLARVVGLHHEVDGRLVDCNRIERSQHADVLHAGIFSDDAAVAVDRKILHDVDEGDVVFEVIDDGPSGIRHGFREGFA